MCDLSEEEQNLPESKKWGNLAEKIAENHLVCEGYTIRERNWRPKNSHLEVDLIVQKEDEIIFVEVKARNDQWIDPIEAVDDKKIKKLIRAANIYLASLPHDFLYRFDIITVEGNEHHYKLDHIVDAFIPPLTTR